MNSEQWVELLTRGHGEARFIQWLFRHLPSAPRCKQCFAPFSGLGGRLASVAGFKPSRKNPSLCGHCLEELPPGGAEVDISVLFADVRGSTGSGEKLSPSDFAALMNRFYRTSTDVLVAHSAIIDKMIGDEVMALFIPGYTGPLYRSHAVEAAIGLVCAMGYGGEGEPWLPIGVGVHAGLAFVGNVGSGGVTDFTALGDTVNIAARLQGVAAPGEIVISETVYNEIADRYPDLEQRMVTLRGRNEPLIVRLLRVQ